MPAYFDSGFSVREPMWHGQGLVLSDYPMGWDDAREKAGLMWEPEVAPSYHEQPLHVFANGVLPANAILLPDRGTVMVPSTKTKTIVRNDTRAEFGPVGLEFELLLHSEMGEIIEAIVGQGAKFETAGSCKEGAQVWALIYLDEPFVAPGDGDVLTLPFLVLLNSHDGSGACKVAYVTIRVVCWNTYNAASMQGDQHGHQFTFRHTSGMRNRIDDAKVAMGGLREACAEWQKLAQELLDIRADHSHVTKFLSEFIPEPPADIVSDRVRANIAAARAQFMGCYEGMTGENHHGTALGLVDSAVEYLDHVRSFRNPDTYMGRTILRPEPLKAKAVNIAREVCLA